MSPGAGGDLPLAFFSSRMLRGVSPGAGGDLPLAFFSSRLLRGGSPGAGGDLPLAFFPSRMLRNAEMRKIPGLGPHLRVVTFSAVRPTSLSLNAVLRLEAKGVPWQASAALISTKSCYCYCYWSDGEAAAARKYDEDYSVRVSSSSSNSARVATKHHHKGSPQRTTQSTTPLRFWTALHSRSVGSFAMQKQQCS